MTRFSISSLVNPWTPNGSAMMSKIGMRGSREAIGSWNTTCRSRRIVNFSLRPSFEVSLPNTSIEPPLGAARFSTSSSVVDLPHPDSPTRPKVSPSRTSRSIPSTANTVPTRRR